MNRYKPIGWRNESLRHSLAARRIKTKIDIVPIDNKRIDLDIDRPISPRSMYNKNKKTFDTKKSKKDLDEYYSKIRSKGIGGEKIKKPKTNPYSTVKRFRVFGVIPKKYDKYKLDSLSATDIAQGDKRIILREKSIYEKGNPNLVKEEGKIIKSIIPPRSSLAAISSYKDKYGDKVLKLRFSKGDRRRIEDKYGLELEDIPDYEVAGELVSDRNIKDADRYIFEER
jgi:hypothetical protein